MAKVYWWSLADNPPYGVRNEGKMFAYGIAGRGA